MPFDFAPALIETKTLLSLVAKTKTRFRHIYIGKQVDDRTEQYLTDVSVLYNYESALINKLNPFAVIMLRNDVISKFTVWWSQKARKGVA